MLRFTRITKSDGWEPVDGADSIEAYIRRTLANALKNLKDSAMNAAFQDGVSRKDAEAVLDSLDWSKFAEYMRDAGATLGGFARQVGVKDL